MAIVKCPGCGYHTNTDLGACLKCGAQVLPSAAGTTNVGRDRGKQKANEPHPAWGILAIAAIALLIYTTFFLGDDSVEPDSRQERIERQFSAFSGVHYELEKVVKAAMNDPDSFEHVETGYVDDGDTLRVQMVYRGKNGFGGTVTERVTARVGLDGTVQEILEQ